MHTVLSSPNSVGEGLRALWRDLTRGRPLNRGAAWGVMIVGALLAFEVFNYSTTQFALRDLLGDLTFGGLRWATILAIAFCGIDFAGIARIFTPQQGRDEPAEVWYLFGAWLLAAGFNAALTWWGVSIAIVNHSSADGDSLVSNHTMTNIVPILVAVMVWLIRVLIIGTFSVAGDRLFSTANSRYQTERAAVPHAPRPTMSQASAPRSGSPLRPSVAQIQSPAPNPLSQIAAGSLAPMVHTASMDGSSPRGGSGERHLQ
jgi:hypothetical protein